MAASLLLRSRTKVKSVINLPPGKLRVLEEYIVNCQACYIVEGLDIKAIIPTC
jgi:hypothetical protein